MAGAFSEAFLAGDPRAEAFLPVDFRKPEARRAHVMRARERRCPLLAPGSVAVVTGQQVGLFLGPLYSVYKAATAIACARALERETQVRCVPVFWLQTEDHDLEEIDHVFTVDREGQLQRLALSIAGSRCSVEHVVLGESVLPLLERLGEGCELFRKHYRPNATLAQAFEGTLKELFEGDGLVIVNPCAHDATGVHLRALREASEISRLLEKREGELQRAGFDVQVRVRPGCPLPFFHPDGPKGPRYRLVPKGAGYALSGREGEVSREAVERGPFSTSALLRPIVQDALLPTVAYVGGPAELSYFAELDPLYDHFGVNPALVLPRARFRCVEAPARRALEALGLTADDVARPLAELLARTAAPAPEGAPDPDRLRRQIAVEIAPVVGEIADAVVDAEPELARAAERTRISVARALRRLTDRYARRLAERDGVTRQRLERLRAALYPDGIPQERVFGWPTLAARIGPAELKRLVFDRLAEVGPFTTALQELRP